LIRTEILFDHSGYAKTPWFRKISEELAEAVLAIRNPPGADDFAILPVKDGNGVPAIKTAFTACLEEQHGWTCEFRYKIEGQLSKGPVDVARKVEGVNRMFAVEWETGNVSSSHRALSKIALGIRDDVLCGGMLVLPSRALYNYLTDRIGNYREVEPYFDIWRHCDVTNRGILAVLEIEHDREDLGAPRLTKGTDGNALFVRKKRTSNRKKNPGKK